MTDVLALRLGREALLTAVMIGGPILAVSLLIGLLVSVFQAATQINEPTVAFVMKAVGIVIALIVFGPWMSTTATDFARRVFSMLPDITR